MTSRQAKLTGLIAQSALYIAGGVNHFWHSSFYVAIMPTHYLHPLALVYLSGAAEVLCGMGLLLPATRRFASWSIFVMLLVFYDVHVHMVIHPERFPGLPAWALYARLLFQLVLLYWAWFYTRSRALQVKDGSEEIV